MPHTPCQARFITSCGCRDQNEAADYGHKGSRKADLKRGRQNDSGRLNSTSALEARCCLENQYNHLWIVPGLRKPRDGLPKAQGKAEPRF